MTRIVALVPMRHHSQRVPGKNYRPVAGKPLFHYILETLLSVAEIEQVAVDTDSETVMNGLHQHFPAVKVIERPAHLRADDVSMNDILEHDTGEIQADFFLQTHATSPLIRPGTVARAIAAFERHYPENDSLFSVTPLQTRLYDRAGRAINHDPNTLLQTQDLPPVFEENSCLYIFTRDNLRARHHRIGVHPFLFEMRADEAWDIDNELDLEICEFMILRRRSEAAES